MSSNAIVDLSELLSPKEAEIFAARAKLKGRTPAEHLRAIAFGKPPAPQGMLAAHRAVETYEEPAAVPRLSSGSRAVLGDEPAPPPGRMTKRGK